MNLHVDTSPTNRTHRRQRIQFDSGLAAGSLALLKAWDHDARNARELGLRL